jgi:hypothetical protein
MHMDDIRPFPFRTVFAGELRGEPVEVLLDQAGEPDERNGDIWVYRFERVPESVIADPKRVVIQFWIVDGLLANCHSHLHFPDGLKYDELLW